jgi:hypothetical protein
MRKKVKDYSLIKYNDLPAVKQEIERQRILEQVDIDFSVFKKTPEEKERLKREKLKVKYNLKRIRPCKEERRRLWQVKNGII